MYHTGFWIVNISGGDFKMAFEKIGPYMLVPLKWSHRDLTEVFLDDNTGPEPLPPGMLRNMCTALWQSEAGHFVENPMFNFN